MPEGDTIHKLAAALAPGFVGQMPSRVMLQTGSGAQLAGQRILSVTARGKHLFIEFESGLLLRTHLGMYGSWHRYGLTESWKKPQRQASVMLEIGRELYICFNAKECELMRASGVRERSIGTRLSLDLLGPDMDLTAILLRARDFLDSEALIVDVLLDQRIACGIGNVYKSEVLLLHRVHPLATLAELPGERLLGIYRTAAELLRRNLQAGPRVTRFESEAAGGLWAYRRAGLPCFECGTPIRYARQGRDWRSTYWCSLCQPEELTKAAARDDAIPPAG